MKPIGQFVLLQIARFKMVWLPGPLNQFGVDFLPPPICPRPRPAKHANAARSRRLGPLGPRAQGA